MIEKKDLSNVDIVQIKQYVSNNQNTDSVAADKAVSEFLNNYAMWKEIVGYMLQGEDGEHIYGAALCIFSGNLYYSTLLSAYIVKLLREEIEEYEKAVDYVYGYKDLLYSNLVTCLHKGGLASRDELKELLKRSLYYAIAQSNNRSFQGIECFAYRSVNDYMPDSFKHETLSMSSPTTFNDPFDCPILELLNQYGDDITKFADKNKGQIAYFRDIEYISDLYSYADAGLINMRDAFFVKSKEWEYENGAIEIELGDEQFLYCVVTHHKALDVVALECHDSEKHHGSVDREVVDEPETHHSEVIVNGAEGACQTEHQYYYVG